MSFLAAVAAQRHPTPLAWVQRPRAPLSDSPLSAPAAQLSEKVPPFPNPDQRRRWEQLGKLWKGKGLIVDLLICF